MLKIRGMSTAETPFMGVNEDLARHQQCAIVLASRSHTTARSSSIASTSGARRISASLIGPVCQQRAVFVSWALCWNRLGAVHASLRSRGRAFESGAARIGQTERRATHLGAI